MVAADYLIRLFESPSRYTNTYSDGQLNDGFWLILDPGASSHFFSLLHDTVPLEKRLRGIGAIFNVFTELFAKRCTQHLSHLAEPGASPLNSICYMWWDVCPIPGGQSESGSAETLDAARNVMEKTLYIENDTCRESALHGLGHLTQHERYASRYSRLTQSERCPSQKIIDKFLKIVSGIRPELIKYAECARDGDVR